MKHTAELVVRSYECDSYGHVNNAVYLNYLEYGRMEFLHAIHFDYNGIIAAGYYLYVTHVDIYYKASAFLEAVSGTFHQVIKKGDGTICAEADVTWACVTTEGKPSRIPVEFLVEGLHPETDMVAAV